jgi:hypothetical protein
MYYTRKLDHFIPLHYLDLGCSISLFDAHVSVQDPSLSSCIQYFNKVRRLAADIRTRQHNAACFSEIGIPPILIFSFVHAPSSIHIRLMMMITTAEFIRICTGWNMGEEGRKHVYAGMIDVAKQGATMTMDELNSIKVQ